MPTGKPRFAVDYRRVNELMVKDAHPLPLPEAMFAQLPGASIFSKLDLTKGFYQIALDPSCRAAAGLLHTGWDEAVDGDALRDRHRPCHLPAGDACACSARGWTSPSWCTSTTSSCSAKHAAEEHAEHVEWVLQSAASERLLRQPGQVRVLPGRPSTSWATSSPQTEWQCRSTRWMRSTQWPTPQSVSDVRRFLGLTGYYRRFVSGFSDIAGPLSDLTRKDTPFVWGVKERGGVRAAEGGTGICASARHA